MRNRVGLTSLVIFVLALSFFLLGIAKPPAYVLDESLHVVRARAILNATADANPDHPPLAKMLMALGMTLAGENSFGWRMPGAVFGALTLVAVFLWTQLLTGNYQVALIATGLTLLNNFLFVMARVAMLDVFYFAFVMWALVAFTAALTIDASLAGRRALVVLSGVFFGFGEACKWSAVVTLAAVILVSGILYVRSTHHLRQIGVLTLTVSFLFLPVLVYGLSFWPWFHRYQRPFTLADVLSVNLYMWRYHVAAAGNPAIDSRWYTWIFRIGPERGLSYLVGNYVVIWGGFLALLSCAWKFCRSLSLPEGLVTLLYGANLLQWVIIPQHRTVYYYYYPCAMFLTVALAIVLGGMQDRRILGVRPVVIVFVAAAVLFVYCYPRMAALEAPYDCALGCWN